MYLIYGKYIPQSTVCSQSQTVLDPIKIRAQLLSNRGAESDTPSLDVIDDSSTHAFPGACELVSGEETRINIKGGAMVEGVEGRFVDPGQMDDAPFKASTRAQDIEVTTCRNEQKLDE